MKRISNTKNKELYLYSAYSLSHLKNDTPASGVDIVSRSPSFIQDIPAPIIRVSPLLLTLSVYIAGRIS